MKVEVYVESERLDLFSDESINLTQNVQDIKDISKIFADYTQSFNVPASKRNNRIFKNYYNADIDNGFDARSRKKGVILVNTLPYKIGKIRLDGVKLKDNKPSSYQITFFGNGVKIKDLLGKDKLGDLEWLSNFDHEYSSLTVLDGWVNGLDFTVDGVVYEDAIIYPLISYGRRYIYNSDPLDTTSEEGFVNIAYEAGRNDGVRAKDLKPAIRLELVIKAITKQYPDLKFVGGFFESEYFKKIYINLNNTKGNIANGNVVVHQDNAVYPGVPSGHTIAEMTVVPDSGFENTNYKIKISVNGEEGALSQEWVTGTQTLAHGIESSAWDEFDFTWEVITEAPFSFDVSIEMYFLFGPFLERVDFAGYPLTVNNNTIAFDTIIRNEIRGIEILSFLTGLFKTFNLTIDTEGEDLMVQDLQTWYTEGRIIDVTKYVDTKSMEVERGVIFNDMKFEFKETKQILAEQYKENNNKGFGDEELQLYQDDTETELLDGETLEVKSVFEHPMYERLKDINTGQLTNIQYMLYVDSELEPIAGDPFMLYLDRVNIAPNPIGFLDDDNIYRNINATVYLPTRSISIDQNSFTLSFGAEFNEYTYNVATDTIFSRYYGDYIGDMFSIKRRNFKFSAILPTSIIQKLKLNDRLVIGNRRYIINKLQSNLTKRSDKLELINDIYDAPLVSDTMQGSRFIGGRSIFTYHEGTYTVQYVGAEGQTPILKDLGDGTGWVTIDSYGTNRVMTITFTIIYNNTGVNRAMAIEIIDGMSNPIYTFTQLKP